MTYVKEIISSQRMTYWSTEYLSSQIAANRSVVRTKARI